MNNFGQAVPPPNYHVLMAQGGGPGNGQVPMGPPPPFHAGYAVQQPGVNARQQGMPPQQGARPVNPILYQPQPQLPPPPSNWPQSMAAQQAAQQAVAGKKPALLQWKCESCQQLNGIFSKYCGYCQHSRPAYIVEPKSGVKPNVKPNVKPRKPQFPDPPIMDKTISISSQKWACTLCTLMNDIKNTHCAACNTERTVCGAIEKNFIDEHAIQSNYSMLAVGGSFYDQNSAFNGKPNGMMNQMTNGRYNDENHLNSKKKNGFLGYKKRNAPNDNSSNNGNKNDKNTHYNNSNNNNNNGNSNSEANNGMMANDLPNMDESMGMKMGSKVQMDMSQLKKTKTMLDEIKGNSIFNRKKKSNNSDNDNNNDSNNNNNNNNSSDYNNNENRGFAISIDSDHPSLPAEDDFDDLGDIGQELVLEKTQSMEIRRGEFNAICSEIACRNANPVNVFNTLRGVTKKLMIGDDPRYRVLDVNNEKVVERLLGFDGVIEFLQLLGFEIDDSETKLIVQKKPKFQHLSLALEVLTQYKRRWRLYDNEGTKKEQNKTSYQRPVSGRSRGYGQLRHSGNNNNNSNGGRGQRNMNNSDANEQENESKQDHFAFHVSLDRRLSDDKTRNMNVPPSPRLFSPPNESLLGGSMPHKHGYSSSASAFAFNVEPPSKVNGKKKKKKKSDDKVPPPPPPPPPSKVHSGPLPRPSIDDNQSDDNNDNDNDNDDAYNTPGGPFAFDVNDNENEDDNDGGFVLDDEKDDMAANRDDKFTLNQIIILATHESLSVRDNTELEVLLMTHRTYWSSIVLLQALRHRYNYPHWDNEQLLQKCQLKVGKCVRQWMADYWQEDWFGASTKAPFYEDNHILFAKNDKEKEDMIAHNPMFIELQAWIDEMKASNNGNPKPWVKTLADALTSEFDRYLKKGPASYHRKSKNYKKILIPKKFDLKNTSTDDFADQLTLICYRIFASIKPREFVGKAWTKSEKNLNRKLAPNILKLTDIFNRMCTFYQISILTEKSLRLRVKALRKILRIGERLRKRNNYHCLLALFAALNSASIFNLKLLWEKLPRESMQTFEAFKRIFSIDNNYQALRLTIRQSVGPCIPYIGIYLQDLVFIEDGSSKVIGQQIANRKLLNFSKSMRIADRIQTIQFHQMSPYKDIKENEVVCKCLVDTLNNVANITSEDLFEKAKQIREQDKRSHSNGLFSSKKPN